MIQVNLLPDIKQDYLRAKRQRNTVISIAIIVGAVAIGLVVLLGLLIGAQAIRNKLADDAIVSENKQLQSVGDLSDIYTIQNQLKVLSGQNTSRTINSRLFDILSAVNPKQPNDVKFSGVTLDPESTTITLSGTAVGGYEAVDTMKKTILNSKLDYTKDDQKTSVALTDAVSIGETSYGESSDGGRVLQFTLSFVYAEDLFSNDITAASINGPAGRTDVTDSKLHVPDSLFSSGVRADEEGN